jgi:hypothetical protein
MANHIWTVLCEKSLVDPRNQVMSLIDLTESLSQEGLGQRLEEALRLGKKGTLVDVELQLVSWWYRSDLGEATLQVRFVLRNPVEKEVFTQPATMVWKKDATTLKITVNIDRFPVTMLGLHWFVVEQYASTRRKPRWVTVTRLPVSFDDAKQDVASSAPVPPSGPIPAAPPESSSQPEPSRPRASREPRRPGSSSRRDPRGGARR